MRKAFYALPIAAVAAFATPAIAQPLYGPHEGYAYGPYAAYQPYPWPVPWVAGAAVGTGVAIAAYNGAFGAGLAGTGAAATAGAAALGGTAAIGAVALTDALLQPCRGFAALFGLNHGACMNGQYVGYAPPPR